MEKQLCYPLFIAKIFNYEASSEEPMHEFPPGYGLDDAEQPPFRHFLKSPKAYVANSTNYQFFIGLVEF